MGDAGITTDQQPGTGDRRRQLDKIKLAAEIAARRQIAGTDHRLGDRLLGPSAGDNNRVTTLAELPGHRAEPLGRPPPRWESSARMNDNCPGYRWRQSRRRQPQIVWISGNACQLQHPAPAPDLVQILLPVRAGHLGPERVSVGDQLRRVRSKQDVNAVWATPV